MTLHADYHSAATQLELGRTAHASVDYLSSWAIQMVYKPYYYNPLPFHWETQGNSHFGDIKRPITS